MIPRFLFISIFLLGFFTNPSLAQNDFEQANQSYLQGDKLKALEQYLNLEREGYQSADLYQNIGRTFYDLDSLGYAMWYWEMAQKKAPRNKAIRQSIDWARDEIILRADSFPVLFYKRWYHNVANFLTSNLWTSLSLLLWLFAFAAAVYSLFGKNIPKRKKAFQFSIPLALLALLLLVSVARSKYNSEVDTQSAILLEAVEFKNGPSEKSKKLFKLSAGNKLTILENLDDWVKLSLPDDQEGWAPKAKIGIID